MLLLTSCHSGARSDSSTGDVGPPSVAQTCSSGRCEYAVQLTGLVIPGVDSDLACRVDSPFSAMELQDTLSDWCAQTDSGEGGLDVDLESCTDAASTRYWRALTTYYCCTDVVEAHEDVWSEDGTLVYARDVDLMGAFYCCCGEAVAEVISGSKPDLTCSPADPASVCPQPRP